MRKSYLIFLIWIGIWVLIGWEGYALGFHDSSRVAKAVAANQGSQQTETQLPDLGQPGSPLLMEKVVAFALANNPQIAAAEERWRAALNRPAVVSALPNPAFGVSYFAEEMETRNGPLRGGITLSQKLPWFGKLDTKSRIAESEANVFKERHESTRLEIIAKVKQVYFELYWITRAIAITKSNIDLMKQFEKVAQAMYVAGEVSQQDVLKAQVEISNLQNELDTFVEMKTTAAARLNALLGRPIEAPLGEPERFEFRRFTTELENLYNLARELSPRLRLHQQLIKRAEQQSKLARLDYYPDFTLGVQYQNIAFGAPMAPHEGQDAWAVMVSMSLPIWWGKTKAGVNEAEMKASSERFAYTDTENMVLMNVKDTYFRLKTAERQVALYRDSIIPRAEQALRVSEKGYRAGQVDFLNLIDSQRMLLHFQFAHERALTDFQQNLAKLEEIVGGKLPAEKSQ